MKHQRLTVHLKKVKKYRVDGKSFIKNTLSFVVEGENEAKSIVASLNEEKPRNNVSKWYLSNVK